MNARRTLLNKIQESLEKKIKESKDKELKSMGSGCAIRQLLSNQSEEPLSMEELKDLSLELLFAGHATCASAATSLLIQLNKNR